MYRNASLYGWNGYDGCGGSGSSRSTPAGSPDCEEPGYESGEGEPWPPEVTSTGGVPRAANFHVFRAAPVREVLEMTGADQVLRVFDTVADAEAVFGG
ncbi:hypothetical protein ACFWWC_36710 [Streptomyces sp. NPDC058642]|uniref:hypothetical protein n=1 Tax=Streptomyces sp. NPDC058642 TaxID=3346572 RepID=UPI003647A14F